MREVGSGVGVGTLCEAGLTQTELARAARVQEDTIASVEQDRRLLVPDLAETIDDLLDTLSKLINSLKGASPRYLRAECTGRINRIGMGPVFWSRP